MGNNKGRGDQKGDRINAERWKIMLVLWNGEYEDHEINDFSEKHLKYMDEQHKKWIGHIVGDFTVLKVEYDWGRRDQRWTIKCNLCGRELYQYHVADWRRGKGRSLECKCRKEAKQAEVKAEKESRQSLVSQKIFENQKRVGEVYGDWKIIKSIGGTRCIIECTTCGKQKIDNIKTQNVVDLKINPCNHKKPIDYSGDEWIGKRNGHLTVIGRNGNDFISKCDCGNEIIVKPTFMFTYKNRKDCGMPNCPYSTPFERASRERRKSGFSFEREIEQKLIEKGYNAIKTQDQADYGVDIIIHEEDGSKIAIQCKKQNDPVGVSAIQEVYAGGRFYDCTKFAVICEQGFSNPAIMMARKLGVYLCDGEFEMPKNINEYVSTLMPVFHSNEGIQKLYDIDGTKHTLSDWCAIYGKPQYKVEKLIKNGCTVKVALQTAESSEFRQFTVRGVTGNLAQICKYFDVLAPTVKYRMEHMGMTLEEAIFTPTKRTAT